jgi:hypothetical protein
MKKDENGFGAAAILVALVIVGVGGVGYYVYQARNNGVTENDSTIETAQKNEEQMQEVADYGRLTIKETGVSFELSKDIADAYYLANDTGGASFGVKSLDEISGCKAATINAAAGTLTGAAVLHYGGGGDEYQTFKSNPNASQVADRFFFAIDAEEGCRSDDAETQEKIEAVQAAFEKAGKTIKIADFSNSYYNQ